MNKLIVIIPILVITITILLFDENDDTDNVVFHATLADPNLYKNGIFEENVFLNGEYRFRFVPNGDSPQILSITIHGETFDFSEDFKLIGTRHQTDISEYYTWDYTGQKTIMVAEQQVVVTIDPNGDVNGPVSVSIIEN